MLQTSTSPAFRPYRRPQAAFRRVLLAPVLRCAIRTALQRFRVPYQGSKPPKRSEEGRSLLLTANYPLTGET